MYYDYYTGETRQNEREYYLDTTTFQEIGELVFKHSFEAQQVFKEPEVLGSLIAPRLLGLKEAYPRRSKSGHDYQYLAISAKLADRKPQIDVAVIQAVLDEDLLTKYIHGLKEKREYNNVSTRHNNTNVLNKNQTEKINTTNSKSTYEDKNLQINPSSEISTSNQQTQRGEKTRTSKEYQYTGGPETETETRTGTRENTKEGSVEVLDTADTRKKDAEGNTETEKTDAKSTTNYKNYKESENYRDYKTVRESKNKPAEVTTTEVLQGPSISNNTQTTYSTESHLESLNLGEQGNALTQKNLGETRDGVETGTSNTSYERTNTDYDYDMKRLAANLENSKNEVITLIASCFIDCLQRMVY